MTHLEQALKSFLPDEALLEELASVLGQFCENDVTIYKQIREITGDNLTDILLELWNWKLIIPIRSKKCGEWDSRILLAEPGESYEMPNISRVLVKNAQLSGVWDSRQAIYDLFKVMSEPEWQKIPDLVLEIKKGCIHNTISAARVGIACARKGLKNKTGTISPVYEFNPSVYAELNSF